MASITGQLPNVKLRSSIPKWEYRLNTLYIKELDSCKFHEHLGMKEYADYLRDTKIKYTNYLGAGLIPDMDIIFTQDKDEAPFDIRYLAAKLNSAVYGSIICRDP